MGAVVSRSLVLHGTVCSGHIKRTGPSHFRGDRVVFIEVPRSTVQGFLRLDDTRYYDALGHALQRSQGTSGALGTRFHR